MSQRFLIVNADDFGQSPGINRGILQAHDQGIVTNTSAMVRWPAVEEAAREAARRPRLSVGLHVDLGEWQLMNGEWTALYEVVPTGDRAAVAAEVDRQLTIFRERFNRNPTHLDSHQHVHRREPVLDVLTKLAAELGVPLRHFSPQVRYCGHFYGQDEEGRTIDQAISVDRLLHILTTIDPGFTELACHPAASVDLPGMYQNERLLELATLCDPRVRDAISTLGIQLCSFHDI